MWRNGEKLIQESGGWCSYTSYAIINGVNTSLGLFPRSFINLFSKDLVYSSTSMSQAPCYKKRRLDQMISKVFSSVWNSKAKPLGFYLLDISIGSFLSFPPSTTFYHLTIYWMNFCYSSLAGFPDVVAGKTREEGQREAQDKAGFCEPVRLGGSLASPYIFNLINLSPFFSRFTSIPGLPGTERFPGRGGFQC